MTKKADKQTKHLKHLCSAREQGTNADFYLVPEVCDMPPEAEALRHIVDVTEDDFDALSIRTS